MANYTATQDAIATGTALKTMIELATPATNAAQVYHWWIDMDGVSSSAVPVLVEIVRATASIIGTALTPSRLGTIGPGTAQTTAKHTGTAGSGTNLGNVIWKRRIPPTTGFDFYVPDNRLLVMDVSTFLRINVTAAATVNATCGLEFDE